MDNASPCVALAACPSLLDLEIVGLDGRQPKIAYLC
ncbi:F-box protein SKIP17 [Corchorus olitorius]|uniref:F-box protein SKIP17 n=1 Tax=Corchorus olitorius TaxID=93759 RepID=A0A1R3K017_9ROSI|nr:F-box protein SKIP17 [Corchorus olitorius]